MVNRIIEYCKQHNMLQAGERIVVGVSGGADSVCLLFVLKEISKRIPVELTAVYVEHGIRGSESAADGDFVEKLCSEWSVEFRKYSYDVKQIAEKERMSVEEAGREVRYKSFRDAAAEVGAAKIAVAHNKDDNSETILMNLVRGSGLKGVAGIPPVRENIIRPLLCAERKEIEKLLNQYQIEWRTDSTNLEQEYTRNKIRLQVLPYLKEEINKQASAHISMSGEIFRQAYEYIYEEAEKAEQESAFYTAGKAVIRCDNLLSYPVIIQNHILMLMLKKVTGHQKDIAAVHVEAVRKLAVNQSGKQVNLPYGFQAKRVYDHIAIELQGVNGGQIQKRAVNESVHVPGVIELPGTNTTISFTVEEKANQIIKEKKCTKWFDYDIIKGNLQLRTRREGDYFITNKEGGHKKLKSFFIDSKIPREERDKILLLAEGSHIIWIVGYRISEYYKIAEETKRVLKVQVSGGE